MNLARLQAFSVLIVLSLIGLGPISLTALIGLYVIWARPTWVLRWVRKVYGLPALRRRKFIKTSALPSQIKGTLVLLGLLTLDILPVPVTGSIALVITCWRPIWFIHWLETVYQQH